METSVLWSRAIEGEIDDDGYGYSFDFPEEWDDVECIVLTGIRVSSAKHVTSFECQYHNLSISMTNIDDDQNLVSMFTVPVIIRKFSESIPDRELHVFTYCQVDDDLTVTLQWYPCSCPVTDDIERNFYSMSNFLYYLRNGLRISRMHEQETLYLRVLENDQPMDSVELDEDIAYTMVSLDWIRIDGPSRAFCFRFPASQNILYEKLTVEVSKAYDEK